MGFNTYTGLDLVHTSAPSANVNPQQKTMELSNNNNNNNKRPGSCVSSRSRELAAKDLHVGLQQERRVQSGPQ